MQPRRELRIKLVAVPAIVYDSDAAITLQHTTPEQHGTWLSGRGGIWVAPDPSSCRTASLPITTVIAAMVA